jgi:steroid delta-isomerase-like uncharacterized protein
MGATTGGSALASDDELRQRRLEVLHRHFQSEVDHDWDACIGTFAGAPRYEIVPTGQVHEGEEAVRAYHRNQRLAFPDQHHEDVRFHVADDSVVAEFVLVGTNTGEFLGAPPTGRGFRVPTIAVFSFDDDAGIVNERVYLDLLSLLTQIGRTDLVPGAAGAG